MHNEQKRTGSEKIEIAAQIGTIVLGTIVSAMQIFRMIKGGTPAES